MAKYKENGRIISQEKLAEGVYSMWIRTDQIAAAAKAGQFISLFCRDKAWMLPRPISICEVSGDKLRIVYRVVGKGTEEFSAYQTGDAVEVMGPLGNGFPLLSYKKPMLIGGGIGIPPMLELAKQLEGAKEIVLGFRDEIFLADELAAYGSVSVATEDGSVGVKGTVLDAIREQGLSADVIFACGPTPMLKALKEYAGQIGIDAWLSLEEKMACGVGACLACVCQTTQKDQHSNVNNRRICKDGPVFEAKEVVL